MKLAALFRFVLFATLLGLASNVWMGERAEQLQTSQTALLSTRLNAINELRLLQSEFDALQTLVAAYVVSQNSQHLVHYYELLDAHAGARHYEQAVDNVYWSKLIAGNTEPVPLVLGQGPTLEDRLMAPERLAPQLTNSLKISVDSILALSRRLREREQIVFALTQGLYDPVLQKYVSEADVREDLAIQMLFSEEYLGMTNAVRAEIQGRIRAVELGFQTVIAQQADNINLTARFDFYLGLLVTLMALIGLAVLQRYVVAPLHELNTVSQHIARGNYSVTLPKPKFVTEMVNLLKGYALMIGSFRRELEQADATRAAELAALEAKMGRERAEAQVEARGMLLANMSHEIRTPMNAILGMTALTLKSPLPERERSYLMKVQDAAKSLLGLLNDVLDYSKAEAGMVEFEQIPFTLDEVLANSFLAVQSQAASRKLILLNEVAPGYSSQLGQRLVGDPSRLRQVLSNLLSNAVKFTESGSIRVYSRLQTRSDTELDLHIEVHDTGSGLSKSQVDRIFEKFAQGDSSVSRVYGGTGLGLSIARELVTRMGGAVSVESTQGKGSCFRFSVPVAYNSDILAEALPLAGQNAVLLHQHGTAANSVLSILRSVGLNTTQVSTIGAFVEVLHNGCFDWAMLQSDLIDHHAALPQELLDGLLKPKLHMVAIDRDLFSADSALLQVLPPGLCKQLIHVAHPVLAQDICAAPRAELSPNPLPCNEREASEKLQGKHVLVLEDHPVNQVLIRSLLEAVGLKVTLCGHGQEAVDLLDLDEAAHVDVIITDLEMPMMDGYEFVSWLRDQTRWLDTPVIGLTGHAFAETRTRCLELGMDDFITKPVEADVLYSALMDALHMKEVPVRKENNLLAQLPNLFMTHCADLPAKLHAHLTQNNPEAFAREIHSLVSLLALLDEQELHVLFRSFEQGLGDGSLKPDDALNQIHAAWPALVLRYTQQADATTPS
ncbi:MAG: response regulator [Gammaproteobacteria bacterium]|nr:response regulator [Gammaproteobacteria bacterium]MBU0849291.1 response regulator [Gammaproteobacteria bacterium]MBU1267755.1 response regulator [Gammaproteobacteria bacterium]MBU1528203.1 response regulator [Gammaproteobacteria bacterium]MBU1781628.1 response regulator [Gammaproteobacteria bacterium]